MLEEPQYDTAAMHVGISVLKCVPHVSVTDICKDILDLTLGAETTASLRFLFQV